MGGSTSYCQALKPAPTAPCCGCKELQSAPPTFPDPPKLDQTDDDAKPDQSDEHLREFSNQTDEDLDEFRQNQFESDQRAGAKTRDWVTDENGRVIGVIPEGVTQGERTETMIRIHFEISGSSSAR
eukprot:gnl/MRDRNA2_/MRDRNA2_172962_c0_seq1.p1 gnl/MRDRNA2_/MRDRNA2_172962_c0~~gnl/MRDRNA2_/MRDRNA2_172962_c0_seq1.p1  ORF type:complete len:126 (+),score=23.88 gnl/MRDRNA2_/MRDRNA2_172962_c0_seq1:131-508(+)